MTRGWPGPQYYPSQGRGNSMAVAHSRPVALSQSRYPGQDLPEITIRIHDLPPDATTLDLWHNFKKEGHVVFVEIFEDRQGVRNGNGKVRFCPPPQRDFWQNRIYKLTKEDNSMVYNVTVVLDRPQFGRNFMMRSPMRKMVRYPEQMKLMPRKLHFGLMLDPSSMMSMHCVVSRPMKQMSFNVDMLRKTIVPKFELNITDPRIHRSTQLIELPDWGKLNRNLDYKFEIKFEHIRVIHRVDLEGNKFALVISLDEPPRFFRKLEDVKSTHQGDNNQSGAKLVYDNLVWSENYTWTRQTDIIYDPDRILKAVLSLNKERPIVDIGRWTTYLWEFTHSAEDERIYQIIKGALEDFNIKIEMQKTIRYVKAESPQIWSLIDPPQALQLPLKEDLTILAANDSAVTLTFDVRYQLEVCISRNLLNEHNITAEFVHRLASLDFDKARNILEYVAEQNHRIYNPMTIFKDAGALSYYPRRDIPNYCAYQRKATITPSKIVFSSPTVETTNRILRHYARENKEGRFLRVQFTDEESQGKINSCVNKAMQDELYTRVFRTMFNGIRIGDRHYQFLAFGNSQFRENGAYFFSPTEHLNCDDIRQWMGNFKHINVIAKYAARLGQCFSTTRAIHGLSKPQITLIDDVERNGCTFTDGVGKLSVFLAEMITSEFGNSSERPSSAYQFRMGGCKGVLVYWPDVKHTQVHIRKSQQKFIAPYNGLEIIRCSRFSNAKLNRQTIAILSALGVPDKVFLDMMANEVSDYESALSNSDLAVHMLSRNVDENQMTINIATMVINGFMSIKEPFVMSLLQLWRTWSIKLLKEKARINVEQGAFVFGCVDETATLKGYEAPKPGSVRSGLQVSIEELPEIFIQVPIERDNTNRYTIIEGVCLVGRNPSLHPGDLRVVRAVNVVALHHLRDVVVFPQTGDRDIPSMCSGGDLDGDDYFVIWDPKLQPQEWNHAPMEQPLLPAKNLRRDVVVADLLKFFVKYMKNDSLPTIARTHMAQADLHGHGVKDPVCLELAALHSKAVDYVKTGQPAELIKALKAREWPHFMGKTNARNYHSRTALGQLYDSVEKIDFAPQYEEPFDMRILQAYKLDNGTLKKARQIKSQYDIAMRRIMTQQDTATEFEIWSTFALSKPKIGTDYKQQEQIKYMSDDLKNQYKATCIEQAGGKDFDVLGPFVAAMYQVTKEEMDLALAECRATKIVNGNAVPKRKLEPKSMPLISFPWLFERELGRIATGSDYAEHVDDLGLPTFTKKQARKATGLVAGPVSDEDDFIEQKDGIIVHRGEELDLFRTDPDEDFSGESDYDESRLRRFERNEVATQEELDAEVNRPSADAGIEDVIPPTKLEGLINESGSEFVASRSEPSGWQPINVETNDSSPNSLYIGKHAQLRLLIDSTKGMESSEPTLSVQSALSSPTALSTPVTMSSSIDDIEEGTDIRRGKSSSPENLGDMVKIKQVDVEENQEEVEENQEEVEEEEVDEEEEAIVETAATNPSLQALDQMRES